MRYIVALTLALVAAVAVATPPYDLTVEFAQQGGGAASGYRVYIDGKESGDILSGQKKVGLLTADGTHEICVRGYNALGEGPATGKCLTATITDFEPLPGPVDVTKIIIECDIAESPPSCTIAYKQD